MLKIAVLCSIDSWGGLEMNTFRLCKWLTERGNEVILLGKPDSKLIKEVRKVGVRTIEFTQKRKHLNLSAAKELASILDKEGITRLLISHYHQFYTGVLSKFYAKNKLKVVFWQHMQMTSTKKDLYHSFFYRNLDKWITPLEYLKQQLLSRTKIQENKIKIIPFGIEVDNFINASKEDKAIVKKQFNLNDADFVVGFIGRLDKFKGQEYIIKALKIIEDKIPTIKLLLIGEETYGEEGYLDELKTLCKVLQVEDKVIFHPFVENTPKAFRALDIFVMSSLVESFGMVTIEAMATATPVIGTQIGSTTDLLQQGELGILVTPEDEKTLAEAILKLYQNPQLREELTQKGQKAIQSKYTHTAQCIAFEEVFTAL